MKRRVHNRVVRAAKSSTGMLVTLGESFSERLSRLDEKLDAINSQLARAASTLAASLEQRLQRRNARQRRFKKRLVGLIARIDGIEARTAGDGVRP